jgi:hypothetical protein
MLSVQLGGSQSSPSFTAHTCVEISPESGYFLCPGIGPNIFLLSCNFRIENIIKQVAGYVKSSYRISHILKYLIQLSCTIEQSSMNKIKSHEDVGSSNDAQY